MINDLPWAYFGLEDHHVLLKVKALKDKRYSRCVLASFKNKTFYVPAYINTLLDKNTSSPPSPPPTHPSFFILCIHDIAYFVK